MKTILIYTREIDHTVETLAAFLAEDPQLHVTLVLSGETFPDREHHWSLRRLSQRGQVQFCNWADDPRACDAMLINSHRLTPSGLRRLPSWSGGAERLGLVSPPLWDASCRRFVREGLNYLAAPYRADSALVRSASGRHPYPMIPNVNFFGIYVHPQFFNGGETREAFRQTVRTRKDDRPFSFGFIGNRSPSYRENVLETLRREFIKQQYGFYESIPRADKTVTRRSVLWIEYGGDARPNALSPEDYLRALEEIEFCICPFGWDRWSHRTMEALAAGSIPILECESSYNRGLHDGINCVVVKNGDWVNGIRRAQALSGARRHEIRENIYRLRDRDLTLEAASVDCRRRLGLEAGRLLRSCGF